jgi:hypothetical protein
MISQPHGARRRFPNSQLSPFEPPTASHNSASQHPKLFHQYQRFATPMSVSFDFDRLTRTYAPDENIHITTTVTTPEQIRYKEISCVVACVRTVNKDGHGISNFDSFVAHTPENTVWQKQIQIDWPRTIENNYKFTFDVKIPRERGMTESVRGKYVSVDYIVELVIKRGAFSNNVTGQRVFFILYPPGTPPVGKPVEQIMGKKDMKKGTPLVEFKARVSLVSDVASFKKPPAGTITIVEAKEPIRTVTVSYMRTEKLTTEKGNPMEFVSEVCRMQIGEKDPPLGIELPFNLEWVRVLLSPDMETPQFSISVGLKVRVIFENDGYASIVIPLKLWRDLAY